MRHAVLVLGLVFLAGCPDPPPPSPTPRRGEVDPPWLKNAKELVSETPPCAERFEGTLALVESRAFVLSQGQDGSVKFALARREGGHVTAAIQKMRVTGFDGLHVAVSPLFTTSLTLADLGALGVAFVRFLVLDWKTLLEEAKLKKFTLDVPDDCYGLGELWIYVPADAPPGRYEGKLELEGNFEPVSLPLAVEVSPFAPIVARAIASLAAPVDSSTPVEKLLAATPRGEDARFTFDSDAPWIQGVWHRWVLAGPGILDLVNLQWVGPIVAAPGAARMRLGGSIERPRVFVLNGESVDLIDVAQRKTVERLVLPRAKCMVSSGFLEVSPDGERVLAGNDQVLCLFVHGAGAWKRTDLHLAKTQDETDWIAWVACDAAIQREVLVGIKSDLLHWRTLHRHDLASGERTEATVDVDCWTQAWGDRQRLLVGVSQRDGENIDLRFIKTPELSVSKLAVEGWVHDIEVDPDTGEVLVADNMYQIVVSPDLKQATKSSEMGPGDPRPRLLEGTSIRWYERDGTVTFSR